jgi:hypothetical protein
MLLPIIAMVECAAFIMVLILVGMGIPIGILLSLKLGKLPPVFFLLTDTADVVFMIVPVECLTAIDTDHGAGGAAPPDMVIHLFLLER